MGHFASDHPGSGAAQTVLRLGPLRGLHAPVRVTDSVCSQRAGSWQKVAFEPPTLPVAKPSVAGPFALAALRCIKWPLKTAQNSRQILAFHDIDVSPSELTF